ncbi:hypothetical protein [Mycoplasma leonicaptivi]|uniref:hypothetical protein n=1 Tax=Mycoplasma leonicaptivi TaxID=36742 RepID=UPI0004841E96|nr:hypothetical protein [Mycoplasma leonicaptivi]
MNNIYETFKDLTHNNKLNHLYLFDVNQVNKSDLFIQNIIKIIINKSDLLNEKQIDFHSIYENLFFIDGSKESIKKEFIEETFNKALLSNKKTKTIIYIKDIENSNIYALNSILKIIEEPVENLYILISSSHKEKILPTILSRSQIVKIPKTPFSFILQETNKDVTDDFFIFLMYLYRDESIIEQFNTDEYQEIFTNLIDILKSFANNKKNSLYKLIIELNKYIIKEKQPHYEFIFKLLKLCFLQNGFLNKTDIFNNKYIKALIEINKTLYQGKNNHFFLVEYIIYFEDHIKKNANFKLQKNSLLVKILRLYE